jgi:hypothetical protein
MAYPHPFAPPPGHGLLAVAINRGPYLFPVTATSRLRVDGHSIPIPAPGLWFVAVPAGQHSVRITDFLGIPAIVAGPMNVPFGGTQHLTFRFGGWRNRVYDGSGADMTRFGMWSNYSIALVTALIVGLVCCCGGGLLNLLGN